MHSHKTICLLQLAEQAKTAIVYFSLLNWTNNLFLRLLKKRIIQSNIHINNKRNFTRNINNKGQPPILYRSTKFYTQMYLYRNYIKTPCLSFYAMISHANTIACVRFYLNGLKQIFITLAFIQVRCTILHISNHNKTQNNHSSWSC